MKDITLGQYYPVKSPIHSLDPRTKLISAVLLICATFLCTTFIGLAVCAFFVFTVAFVGHIPVSNMLNGLKTIYFLLIFTFLLNMFFYSGGTVIFELWVLKLTTFGIKRAGFMALRLMLLITGAGLLTFTTSPIELTDGLESLMTPLKKIKFPAHEIAMMMSIALRFIPILSEETDKIMKAQSARGAVFDRGSLFKRARALVALLIPLLVSAFRRADDLALAMEARCYHGGEGRTRLKVLKMNRHDAVAFAVMLLLLCAIISDKVVISGILPMLAG